MGASNSDAANEVREFNEKRAYQYEREFRAKDNLFLPVTKEGYVEALQNAEANAILSAIYHYGRYLEPTFDRIAASIEPAIALTKGETGSRNLSAGVLKAGLTEKRSALETELAVSFRAINGDKELSQDLLKWRRGWWLSGLKSKAIQLHQIDYQIHKIESGDTSVRNGIDSLAASDPDVAEELAKTNTTPSVLGELIASRNRILEDEPLLSVSIPTPSNAIDKRPVYWIIYDIYFRTQPRHFHCGIIPDGESNCRIPRSMGIGPRSIRTLYKTVRAERESLEPFADNALQTLVDTVKEKRDKGEKWAPADPFLNSLNAFNGGRERLDYLINDTQTFGDEERLVERMKHEYAFFVLRVPLENIVKDLRKELLSIRERTFADYVAIPNLRKKVLGSFNDNWRPAMKIYDAELLLAYKKRQKFIKRARWGAYIVASIVSVFFYPEVAVAGWDFVKSPWVLATMSAVIAQAGHRWVKTKRNTALANIRPFFQEGSYEAIARANEDWRHAVLTCWIEVLFFLRLPEIIKPAKNLLVKALAREHRGFRLNPFAKFQVTRVATPNGRTFNLSTQSFGNGMTLVWRTTKDGARFLGRRTKRFARAGAYDPFAQMAKYGYQTGSAGRRSVSELLRGRSSDGTFFEILKDALGNTVIGFATWNMVATGLVMGGYRI